MSKIIVIDPGHGGQDPGAVANGLREKDLTLDISKRTKKYLDDNYSGHKVLLTRTTDKFLSLSDRANFANRNNATYFMSIHINAGGGTGYESFIHTSNSSGSRNAQNTIHSEAIKGMKVRDRGKKRANFAVLRQTKMPAILPENLFIDRKEDAAKLKQPKFLNEVAKGHAIGIAKALGLKKSTAKKKESTPAPKKDTPVKKQDTSKLNMKTNSIVTYLNSIKQDSSYSNRKKLAEQHGIKNYRGTAAQNTRLLNLLRSGSKPKTNNSSGTSSKVTLKVGSKVKIKSSAGNYSRTTTAIPSKHKNKTYTIQQVAKNDVLIKELYSWVRKSDLVGGGSISNKTATSTKKYTPKSYKVGSKVKIKSSARTYSRSTAAIPTRYKNKTYTIQQVSKDDVLIRELYSWVRKSDLV